MKHKFWWDCDNCIWDEWGRCIDRARCGTGQGRPSAGVDPLSPDEQALGEVRMELGSPGRCPRHSWTARGRDDNVIYIDWEAARNMAVVRAAQRPLDWGRHLINYAFKMFH